MHPGRDTQCYGCKSAEPSTLCCHVQGTRHVPAGGSGRGLRDEEKGLTGDGCWNLWGHCGGRAVLAGGGMGAVGEGSLLQSVTL